MPPDVLLRKLTYLKQLLNSSDSIQPALSDFKQFLAVFETRLNAQ